MTRLNLEQHNINVGRDVSREVGIPGVNTGSDLTSGLNEINITGFGNLGETSPSVIVSENWQVNDTFHWTRGRHSIRIGGEVARRRYNAFQASTLGALNFTSAFTSNPATPAGTGIGLADLLLGRPISGNIQVIDGTRGFRRTEFGLYIQDDLKLTPRLTLNVGLRYELFPGWPWIEVGDRQSQFVPELGDVFLVNCRSSDRRVAAQRYRAAVWWPSAHAHVGHQHLEW